ncbi:MAG TPA: cyclic nucleotide-binding domain-containing protein [Anaerolineales bacterium]|nr:cyclic nucleotide-binding domain-containing protein [Anaerolineales bacterium]
MNRIAVFQELDEDVIELLSPLFETFSCEPGAVIFQQGDQAEFLYLVIDGKVDMSFKPYDGNSITISHVGRGGLFGWSAVVGRDRYTSTAIAIGDVKAFRVHGNDLRRFCREHPEAGKVILERLADGVSSRWKDAHKQVQSLLFQGIAENPKIV